MPTFEKTTSAPSVKGASQSWFAQPALVQLFCCAALYFVVLGAPALLLPTLYPTILIMTEWNQQQVVGFASVKFAAGALAALASGFVVARLGSRETCLLATLGVGLSLSLFALVEGLTGYYLLSFFIGAFTITASISLKTFITETFVNNQGMALGIALFGAGLGGAISPLAAQSLLVFFDWQTVIALFGFAALIVLTLVYPLFPKPLKPSDAASYEGAFTLRSLQQRVRSSHFMVVGCIVFLSGFSDQAITQTTKVFLELDLLFSGMQASLVLSLIVIVSLFSRLLFGWLFDKYLLRGLTSFMLISACASGLLLVPFSPLILGLFILLRGAAQGGRILHIPVLTRLAFGLNGLPQTLGLLTSIYCVGMSIGPAFATWIYSASNHYALAFLFCMILQLICAFALIRLPPPKIHKEVCPPL